MRVPGMVVLVDGYNTTLSAWPGLPLPEQRRRLVDALAELAARTGVDAHAVFDGVEAGRVKPPPGGRLPVRVTFTPAGVDADDVILDLVESMASHRPVAVASNDREVQGEARERGAAVLTLEQLFGVLRRQPRG
jgi:predicted RNA-binding protein with PIN domain